MRGTASAGGSKEADVKEEERKERWRGEWGIRGVGTIMCPCVCVGEWEEGNVELC